MKMRAAIRTGFFGGSIGFMNNEKRPEITKPTQVKVKVHSSAINPVDYKLPKFMAGKIIGFDFAGTIEEVGDAVTDFKVGDEVFGGTKGSLAEYTVTESTKIAKKGDKLTFSEAAALPVAYVTGLQGLKIGKVTEGSSVLVIGASGGCGLAGIQLAKALGASRIVGICSKKNSDLVKKTGATDVICYDDEIELSKFYADNLKSFDCIYDTATGSGGGEDYRDSSIPLLKANAGEYVAINGSKSLWVQMMFNKLPEHQHLFFTDMNTQACGEVVTLLEKNDIKPLVNNLPFTEESVLSGFDLLKSRRTKGKIVFEVLP